MVAYNTNKHTKSSTRVDLKSTEELINKSQLFVDSAMYTTMVNKTASMWIT